MSTYCIGDLHGIPVSRFHTLLKDINFSDDDTLYVIGDVVDRGNEGLHLMLDMMCRTNVYPILGNHDFICAKVLRVLKSKITNESLEKFVSDDVYLVSDWMTGDGASTYDEFLKLNSEEQDAIIEYFEEFSLYEDIIVNNQRFVLVHAGLGSSVQNKPLDSYNLEELLIERMDYSQKYSDDFILVSGHTPTFYIHNSPTIYKGNNHIAIDCGACFKGGKLACIRLDDLQEFYG